MLGLRETAHNDLTDIIADPTGFVWSCTITSPAGDSMIFDSRSNDIHLSIDDDSGDVITSRQATCAVLMRDLIASGFEEIAGIVDTSIKPWLVNVDDINGINRDFKVIETFPDLSLGLMVLVLEVYKL